MADRLKVTELDFDTIKTNLRAFLNQQTEFTDYDFEGSGLSVLLDILAYNTHYNAYYLNMVANESFLDTAILRDSVVSHAKSLGYVPHSTTASVATINFTANSLTSTSGTLTLPAGFGFLSNQIDSKPYNFIVLNDITVSKANNSYLFENLEIYEGQLVTYRFVHNSASNPKQTFTLPEESIDTSTIKIQVSPSSGNTELTVYNLVSDILDVKSDSEVFYLQENKSGKYQIYFGNNVIGKSLPDGAIVSATFLKTNGTASNKANNFVATAGVTDSLSEYITNFVITPISAAAGGAVRESVDDIKFGAVAQFTTQNRLITTKDYESYIKKNYPSVDSLSVWGGEDEIPKSFGKIFVSLKPKANYYISETEKQRIINEIISPKSIVSVDTVIRDPEYLFLILSNYVEYDKRKTTQTSEAIKNSIRNAIILYNQTNLNKFGSTFVLSKLQDSIDNVNLNAIIGSETLLKLQKRFQPDLTKSTSYTINFNAELNRGTINEGITSTPFDVFDTTGIRRTVLIEEIPQSFTGVTSIDVTNGGTGYLSSPIVTITGDGSGATATATIVNGRVTAITVINRGSGYTRAIVTLSGGNGYAATASAVVDGKFGTLRTVYFDELVQRQIVSANAGEINYVSGTITLNNLRVLSVSSSDGLIRLAIGAERGIISSSRSTIIAIDETDSSSIVTELVEIA
jgi:hypothetical protein